MWATIALFYVKGYMLAFFKRLETFAVDSGEVNEYVTAVFKSNEAVTFISVEPFNSTLFHKNETSVCA
ncbi:hypothetical protein FD37_GL000422 [Levilactobacillus spicheri DSM 15429]|uniref:Uncharacterized protein n=1 Tax=Levilactobacillus spicheri DSM 15429 TaxID=1423805 RepID=A0A0R1QQE7_9LACO|nr:hypothetical protein FD37_GL000422 [Levilactobacillus spicheri DSM 15429]